MNCSPTQSAGDRGRGQAVRAPLRASRVSDVTVARVIARAVVPVHSDLIRSEMWPKLITTHTAEAIPVASIPIDSVSSARLAVKKNLP